MSLIVKVCCVLVLSQNSELQELQCLPDAQPCMRTMACLLQLTHVITLSVSQTHCVFLQSDSLHAGG